jgi:hypothetical protein
MPKPEDLDETINCVEKRRSDDRGVADVHKPGLNTSQVATAHMTQPTVAVPSSSPIRWRRLSKYSGDDP